MTNEPIKTFNKLIEANWECNQAIENGNYTEAFTLADTVHALKKELREDMGAEEYDKFIQNGRKMFSPTKLTVSQ